MAGKPAVILDYTTKATPEDGGAKSSKGPGSLMINVATSSALGWLTSRLFFLSCFFEFSDTRSHIKS